MYVVHGRDDCPFCVSALNLLSSFKGQKSYTVRFFAESEKGSLILEQQKWQWETVPVIVEMTQDSSGDTVERLVGGYTDLCEELEVDPDVF